LILNGHFYFTYLGDTLTLEQVDSKRGRYRRIVLHRTGAVDADKG
jgi:hypothetical protein